MLTLFVAVEEAPRMGQGSLSFRVLGDFEVHGRDGPLRLTAHKPRALLALLALNAGRLVQWCRLTEELWGAEPPRSAIANLRTYAADLRRLVCGPGQQLVADPQGYRLVADEAALDVTEFDRLCGEAAERRRRGDLLGAEARYEAALLLWRGPPLAGLRHGPTLAAAAAALDERRIGVVESLFDVRLDLLGGGRCETGAVAAELRRHIAEHPLREGLHRQLVVALYRLGETAGALDACAAARAVYRERLGLDADDRLDWLTTAVLQRDPALLRPGAQHGPSRTGRQVPRPVPDRTVQVAVVGRAGSLPRTELERLGRLLARRGAVLLCDPAGPVTPPVTAGARAEGGTVIGIGAARPTGVTAAITVGRDATLPALIDSADAVIAVGGGCEALAGYVLARRCGDLSVVALAGGRTTDVAGLHHAADPQEAVDLAIGRERLAAARPPTALIGRLPAGRQVVVSSRST